MQASKSAAGFHHVCKFGVVDQSVLVSVRLLQDVLSRRKMVRMRMVRRMGMMVRTLVRRIMGMMVRRMVWKMVKKMLKTLVGRVMGMMVRTFVRRMMS